jgi:hypothetical protein
MNSSIDTGFDRIHDIPEAATVGCTDMCGNLVRVEFFSLFQNSVCVRHELKCSVRNSVVFSNHSANNNFLENRNM